MNITQSKNNLAQCRSRARLFETLASECEVFGFDFDMSRSLSKNAAAARVAMRFKAAELIGYADKIEGEL